jgi:hypothetical protein
VAWYHIANEIHVGEGKDMGRESVWSRAWKDTEQFRASAVWFWIVEVVGAAMFGVIGGTVGFWLTPQSATSLQKTLYPVVGAGIGIVTGFIVAFVLIFTWNLFRAPYRQRNDALSRVDDVQQRYDTVLDSIRFALAFDTVVLTMDKGLQGRPSRVGIGIRFQNTSKELIQYNVVKFNVTLDGKTVQNPTFLNTTVHVHPGKTSDFFYPAIDSVDSTKRSSGVLEYEVEYSSIPNKYWYMSGRRLSIELVMPQAQIVWRALEEKEAPIDKPSEPIKPVHQGVNT